MFTKDMNDGKHVFVFGSNLAGIHGAGAAATAEKHWGAKRGVGIGHTGHAYAIPTKDAKIKTLELRFIRPYVAEFVRYAHKKPGLTFLVTPIGTGLAGYEHHEIAPLFEGVPANCVMPDEWTGLFERAV